MRRVASSANSTFWLTLEPIRGPAVDVLAVGTTLEGFVSATTVKLLQAASEIVGGNKALAMHLLIGEALLARFMEDSRPSPDALLLRAVDIILADRVSRTGLAPTRARDGAVSGDGLADRN